jgi:class 3 adenylate cyclase/ketosteroid isomerase-like protein
MVKESPELVAVAMRWVEAMNGRDFETAANFYQRSEHFRYIGSDVHEWWKGIAPIDAYGQHQSELPDYVVEVLELEAFESGSFGWAALRTRTTFGKQEPRDLRFTFVFVIEAGMWRIVQSHGSISVSNPEVIGYEMTKSLEDLLSSMGQGVEDELRSSVREGTVTILFTDIEGSTELAASVGDVAWADTIDWHDAKIRSIVEARAGSVVKTLGDGAMTVFSSVREAARAAIDIQRAFEETTERPRLRLRIGLHAGDAVLTESDYLGTAVNKAARIASAAMGGEIIVSSSAKALLSDDNEFSFGETRSVELKGIDGVHEITEVLPRPAIASSDA